MDSKKIKKSIWRNRGRRFVTGLNVLISLVLAGILVGMINYMAYRYYAHWDLSWSEYYKLSDTTKGLLNDIDGRVDVTAFVHETHEFYDDVKSLLSEYQYAADASDKLYMNIEFVDPDRDLVKTKELASKYDVGKSDAIIFEFAGRKKYVEVDSLAHYEGGLEGRTIVKRLVGFSGELLFSSAIQSVVQAAVPKVYFLTGHGERNIDEFNEQVGYSDLAKVMRRDNMELAPLLLADHKTIPADCTALVIAGPDRRLSRSETDLIAEYLDRNGRLMMLVDPGVNIGMDDLMKQWGVRLAPEIVVGLTLTGRELVVAEYGDHGITRNLKGDATMFYMPRCVEAIESPPTGTSADAVVDKPKVTVIAGCGKDGWRETDLRQSPPKLDPDVDKVGPASVALAVERGAMPGLDVELKPTRIVVIGDSYFVSNAALNRGIGGNESFFMSSMNWLVERESLMTISPKDPSIISLGMDRGQRRTAFLVVSFLIPLIVAMLGIGVWLTRRN